MITLMYQSGTGAASIDVPQDDLLEEVHLEITHTGDVDQNCIAQLSFGSSASASTNDARQTIATLLSSRNIVGTAASDIIMNRSVVVHPNVKILAGERLYLHADFSAGTGTVRATLYTQKAEDGRPVRRR